MTDVVRIFEDFFEERMRDELMDLAQNKYPDESRSVNVDWNELSGFSTEVADALLEQPDQYVEWAADAVKQLNLETAKEGVGFEPHIRFYGLPSTATSLVKNVGAAHLGKLFQVKGVVQWITELKPLMNVADWYCPSCPEVSVKTASDKSFLKKPNCPKCKREMLLQEKSSEFINFQRAQMQETVEELRGSAPAARLELWMEDDITNYIMPGEKIVATGVLRLRPLKNARGRSSIYEKFMDVVHLRKVDEQFETLEVTKEEQKEIEQLASDPKVYEKIVKSIAPSIHGFDELKQAIALQLFGGTPNKVQADGARIRPDMHLLLIGDPGCLVAGERIALGDGTIARIGSLGEKHLQKISQPLLTGQGYKRTTAKRFHVYRKQKIMELVTESGKSIKGTFNHPLLVVNGMKREWKQLNEIHPGERVAVVPRIPCTKTALVETGWKKEPRRFGSRSNARLPKALDADIAGLLGYVLGDGWVRRTCVAMDVNTEEEDLIPLLVSIIQKKFDIAPSVRVRKKQNRKPITIVECNSVDVASNLSFLKEKRVPELVFQSGNRVAASFLSWLFEADGCVFSKGCGKRAIQLKSSEPELLRDVQMLLLRFGVHSCVIDRNLAVRRAQSIRCFAKSIGFQSAKKKGKLGKLVADCKRLHHEHGKELSERVVLVRPAGAADVFDVEAPPEKRFIANGIISHNTGKSSILEYVSRLAPKSVTVSGGAASGVGLTASAEKDSLGEGWILKAGAMVLANGGIAIIDEFDKMCLSGDSLVYLGGGEIKRIEEIFEEAEKEFGSFEDDGVRIVKANIPVLTHRKGRIVTGTATAVTRRKTREALYEITLRSGKRLKATASHPILLLNEQGELEYKRVRELRGGEFAVCPHKTPSPALTSQKIKPLKMRFTKVPSPELVVGEDFGALMGYLTAEGCAPSNPVHGSYRVDFVNYSPEIADNYCGLARGLGFDPKTPPSTPHSIRINSKNFVEVMKTISPTLNKGARNKCVPSCVMKADDGTVAAFLSSFVDGDGGVYSNPRSICFFSSSLDLIRQLQGLLLRFGAVSKIIRQNKEGFDSCYRLVVQGDSLRFLSGCLTLAEEKKRRVLAENKEATGNKKRFASLDTVPNAGALIKSARKKLGLHGYQLGLSRGTVSVFERGLSKPSKKSLKKMVSVLKSRDASGKASQEIEKLAFLADCGLYFDEITSLNEIDNEDGFTYNLSVEGDKNFIANGVIVHNSEEDRGSIHQAMEQQKISIAKAGIVTEFRSETAVLAAANPKMGRFDPNKFPAEQFNISPALLSRFDLIFTVRDVLDETKDRELASHVLAGHKYASHGESPPEDSPLLPEIGMDLLRKYIAYAHKTCFPVLTDEAINKIREYYVTLRKTGKEQSTFPITARQIEGIIRLAEASAKMRLSEKVTMQDADRAIALQDYVLELVFLDKETGLFDSDIINIGKPKSQIDQMRNVMDIVRMLGEEHDLVEIEEIKRQAADYGIDSAKVEKYVADLLKQGELYQPKYGFVKSARRK